MRKLRGNGLLWMIEAWHLQEHLRLKCHAQATMHVNLHFLPKLCIYHWLAFYSSVLCFLSGVYHLCEVAIIFNDTIYKQTN